MKCRWWNRWWHRRLRRYDKRFMLTAICNAAVRYGENPANSIYVQRAWQAFLYQPGQEHWHCECAHQEATLQEVIKP
jgi:hypothetical protein